MKFPNGWFTEDMIIFNELDNRGFISKGFEIKPHDYRSASNSSLNDLHHKLNAFITSLQYPVRVQWVWSVDSDHHKELEYYRKETERLCDKEKDPWTYFIREQRYNYFKRKMDDNVLRKERLHLYITMPIDKSFPFNVHENKLLNHYQRIIDNYKTYFSNYESSLKNYLGFDGAAIRAMTNEDYYMQYSKTLNPSLVDRKGYNLLESFDPMASIQDNCLQGDIVGNQTKSPENDFSFYFDGYYHSVLAINRWPQSTHPGIVNSLTSLPIINYSLTMNIMPVRIEQEITKEEKKIIRLQGDLEAEKKFSLLANLTKAKERVLKLASGHTFPYESLVVVHTWAKTKKELVLQTELIKARINQTNGAKYWETGNPASAKNLFFMSMPGWTFGKYTKHSLKAENTFLVDMIPYSSSFGGFSEEAEALYDGEMDSLIGIKNFINGTPQHAAMIGASGSGKSFNVSDLLMQTKPYYGYTLILEEGNSYGLYTKALGYDTIIIHPDSHYTINYLDTHGLPVTPNHITNATVLVSKMCGETESKHAAQIRQAQISQYITQLYADTFKDWRKNNEHLIVDITRRVLTTQRYLKNECPIGATYIDAWTELRDKLKDGDKKLQEEIDSVSLGEATKFLSENEKLVQDSAYAYFKAEEYPQHHQLVELMGIAPHPDHDPKEIADLATLLDQWCAHGRYGVLFDGVTNISITDEHAHFELGMIPEGASEMKSIVALLISTYARNHIMSLPRGVKKRVIFEEVARFLDVPGGETIVSECYAQMRKFNTWIISIVQQYTRFKQSNIRSVIMGNSKQFFFLKQRDRGDLDDMGEDVEISEAAKDSIQSYPAPEALPESDRHSCFMYYHDTTPTPIYGTIKNYVSPEIAFVASTTGENVEQRSRQLKSISDKDLIEAIKEFSKNQNTGEHNVKAS